jgi:hypothetical protein
MKRDSYFVFPAPSSGQPLKWVLSSGRTVFHGLHPHPSSVPGQASDHGLPHDKSTGATASEPNANQTRADAERNASAVGRPVPRVTRHIRSAR